MKPFWWLMMMRLPRPRTPLPLYMTLPSAAAATGSPSEPPMSMPLVLLLNACRMGPLAGPPQLMRLASEARGGVGTVAGASAGGVVAAGGSGWSSGTGLGSAGAAGVAGVVGVADGVLAPAALPDSFSTWPTDNWLASLMLFQRLISSISRLCARAIWYSVSPGLTTYVPPGCTDAGGWFERSTTGARFLLNEHPASSARLNIPASRAVRGRRAART